jgi:hypothetical protein
MHLLGRRGEHAALHTMGLTVRLAGVMDFREWVTAVKVEEVVV